MLSRNMQVSEEQKEHVRGLLIQGKKIEAIKYLRSNFDLDLKSAKRMADLIDKDIEEDEYKYQRSIVERVKPAKGKIGCGVGILFSIFGMAMLAGAFFMWSGDQSVVDSGETAIGTVISDPYQPTIEYEFEGQIYTYTSSTQTDPPSYHIGEEVTIFINPADPEDIVIDTFSDRWFGVTILGGMGLIFFVIGLVAFSAFRK